MGGHSLITLGCAHAHSPTYMQNMHITYTRTDKHWKQNKGLNAENLKMKNPVPDHTGDEVSVLSISFPTNAHVCKNIICNN